MKLSRQHAAHDTQLGPLFIAAILICVILNPLNSSTISVALPTLLHHFHTNAAGITWIVSGYYLGSAIAQPVMGKLGDEWGRRFFVYIGLCLMVLTALLAPLSSSLVVFVLWRVVQAIGTSMIFPNAIGLLREHRAKDLGKVLGWIGMAGGIAVAMGPTIGGFLVDWLSWHAIFWLNIPFALAGGLILWRVLPKQQKRTTRPTKATVNRTDWLGISLFAVAITSWLLWSNLKHPFVSTALLMFVLSLLFTAGLLFVEWKKEMPIIPVRWFRHRQFTFSSSITVIANLIMYSILYGLPVFLQTVRHFSAADSGIFLLVYAGVMSVNSPLGGYFAQGSSRKLPLFLAGALLAAGVGLIWWGLVMPLFIMIIGLVLLGVSFAISNVVIQQIFLESVPPTEAGQASGVYTMFRYLGTIVSSALIGGSINTASGAHHLFMLLFIGGVLTIILTWGLRDARQKTG
ncbi:MFS transporter [Alicyclobacillus fodiniaquatilis]|uniref:MFS transporter n=1 Tax=Alicyclobacillus fodiniaquatilis TaxID=1661150 RepID=A0ABW4JEZ0_9BACL